MLKLTLERADLSQPWGFRLAGGLEFQQPIIVQKVTPGSVASEHIQAGDVIVAIDDHDVTNVGHAVAMETIKMAANTLVLTINRNENQDDAYNQLGANVESPEANYYRDNPLPLSLGNAQKPDYRSNNSPAKTVVPDPVLNMAARGDPARKPFAYVADVNDIQQQREKVKRNRTQVSVPHYQNMLNSGDVSPTRGAPRGQEPQGPAALPPGAVVQNLQFNSPLQMYSTNNVVDALKGQTGGDISGVVGLTQKDQSDFTKSAVYKMVHGLDQPKAKPVIAYAEYNTDNLYRDTRPEIDHSSINFGGAAFENGEIKEDALRYKGNSIPSKSFRLLQNMTDGEIPIPLPHGKPIPTPDDDTPDYRPQGRRRGPGGNRINLRQEPTPQSQCQYPPNHQPPRHEPEMSGVDETPLQHLRYVGNNIPCKSFRMLQHIVGENEEIEGQQGSPTRTHPARQLKQMKNKKNISQEAESTDF